jgi:uncharacterized RDD family membrane protein YckC
LAFCAKCGKELPPAATFCPACGTPVAGATPAATGATPSQASPTQTPPMSGIDSITKDQKAQSYWVNRFIAFIVDALIVYIPLAILTFIVAVFVALGGGFSVFGILFGGVISILWSLLFVLYFTFTESMWGASFGKRFFHLKVVSKTGANPTIAEGFIRNLSKIYWLLLLLDVIVGLALSKGYQQKYSDQFMGTKVVSTQA